MAELRSGEYCADMDDGRMVINMWKKKQTGLVTMLQVSLYDIIFYDFSHYDDIVFSANIVIVV